MTWPFNVGPGRLGSLWACPLDISYHFIRVNASPASHMGPRHATTTTTHFYHSRDALFRASPLTSIPSTSTWWSLIIGGGSCVTTEEGFDSEEEEERDVMKAEVMCRVAMVSSPLQDSFRPMV